MAIVRTTTSPGEVPDPKKQTPSKSIARPATGRTLAPNRSQAPAKPGTFINDTMAELRRVVWPSREERISGTIVTVGLLIFFGFYIFGLDKIVEWIFRSIGLYSGMGK
jgi:preprotein translocase SecE subunit